FCELLIKRCVRLESIRLVTKENPEDKAFQALKFSELKSSLAKRGISLSIAYSNTLHDREIYLNNGWIIKIGRGLDFFKSTHGQLIIGSIDLSLRPCLQTTIDIFATTD
ncbi:Uncharacterized protein FKW44_010314, partial [Caligus rogercresseyi]